MVDTRRARADYQTVLDFWFEELTPKQHFQKSDELDQTINERFGKVLQQAAAGECYSWRQSPEGRLAEIIVLDQFSRNIYRGTPEAFSQDPMALALAQTMVQLGLDSMRPLNQRAFVYMPYMHSESLMVQNECVELFAIPGLESNHRFAIRHRDIVERFARFPHRNEILARESTEEEVAFLKTPGSGF